MGIFVRYGLCSRKYLLESGVTEFVTTFWSLTTVGVSDADHELAGRLVDASSWKPALLFVGHEMAMLLPSKAIFSVGATGCTDILGVI